jgi:hypothetical protein
MARERGDEAIQAKPHGAFVMTFHLERGHFAKAGRANGWDSRANPHEGVKKPSLDGFVASLPRHDEKERATAFFSRAAAAARRAAGFARP